MNARRAITLVAVREIRERLRSKVFIASTLAMLVLVGGSGLLVKALEPDNTYRVAVVAPVPSELQNALQRAAKPFDDATVRLLVVASPAAGRRALEDEHVDALLLLSESRLVFRADVDAKAAAIADAAVRTVRRHLPPTPELTSSTLEPVAKEPGDAEVLTALASAVVLLLALTVYGQWVLTGVVEEKSNRVVELVLSTVRSHHLLAGKVIGIGLLGLGQLALIGGLAAVLLATGALDAPTSLGGSVALVVPWFALGFALYSVAYATAGALASRVQDANSAGLPITYTLIAVYWIGYVALGSDDNGLLAHLLTLFPLSAPLVLPARSALVGVPLWEHTLAVALALATIYTLVRLAGRVYTQGLLRSGPRIGLRAAVRMARRA